MFVKYFYIHIKYYNTCTQFLEEIVFPLKLGLINRLHPTILSNYIYNTTRTGPQGAK